MGLGRVLIAFCDSGRPVFPAPRGEGTVFSPLYTLASFVITEWTAGAWVSLWASVLFPWSPFLALCQYHTVLMTVACMYSLKSGRLISSAPFSFSGWLWLCWVCCASKETCREFVLALWTMSFVLDRDCTESVDGHGEWSYLDNLESFSPRTRSFHLFVSSLIFYNSIWL